MKELADSMKQPDELSPSFLHLMKSYSMSQLHGGSVSTTSKVRKPLWVPLQAKRLTKIIGMVFYSFFEQKFPDAPCREHLHKLPLECGHFSPDVGK